MSDDPLRLGPSDHSGSVVLGQVIWLLMRSPLHQRYRLADVERYTAPPLLNGQFKLYRNGPKPIAFASWAMMSAEAEERFLGSRGKIEIADWRSGDRLWIMDLVAPFGHAKQVVDDLRSNVFPGRRAKAIRAARRKGEEPKVIRLRGKPVHQETTH